MNEIKVDVCIFAFDILYLNGQLLVQEQLNVRREMRGLIFKTLKKGATYEPSIRSRKWLKLKKDYMETLGDSLDLVPIAAFHDRGNHTGVYGAFLFACYDNDREEFQSICNVETGFSEAMLKELCSRLRSKVITKLKVKGANLTISPVYHAAVGIVNPDKVADMYNSQPERQ